MTQSTSRRQKGRPASWCRSCAKKAAARRENGDRLIVGTNSRQAGFNSHDVATRLLSLADLIVHEFPYLDKEDDEY